MEAAPHTDTPDPGNDYPAADDTVSANATESKATGARKGTSKRAAAGTDVHRVLPARGVAYGGVAPHQGTALGASAYPVGAGGAAETRTHTIQWYKDGKKLPIRKITVARPRRPATGAGRI